MNKHLVKAVVTLNQRINGVIEIENDAVCLFHCLLWEPGDKEPWKSDYEAAKWLRDRVKDTVARIGNISWQLDMPGQDEVITIEEFRDRVPFRAPDRYGPVYGDPIQDIFSYATWIENDTEYTASWWSSRTDSDSEPRLKILVQSVDKDAWLKGSAE